MTILLLESSYFLLTLAVDTVIVPVAFTDLLTNFIEIGRAFCARKALRLALFGGVDLYTYAGPIHPANIS